MRRPWLSILTYPAWTECIAEFTGRPLLAITCGDLGTDEVAMERELGKWLNLAHKWGAVMLIDEADVFLEKRMESDLKRNSLVSGTSKGSHHPSCQEVSKQC